MISTLATRSTWLSYALMFGLSGLPFLANAQTQELNLYSARHYDTDEALYRDFTKQTGIKINRIEAGDEQLLERIRNEGTSSKADVILLVDAARLWKAEIDGMFQAVNSPLLKTKVPVELRSRDDGRGSAWFGISTRARLIVVNKVKVPAGQVTSYEDLASPALRSMVCTRSGTHPYMLSWIGAMTEHLGREKARSWARAVVSNFARTPRGGDTDQIKAVARGECGVAVINSYYLARILRSDKAQDRAIAEKLVAVLPNQNSYGTHMNVSGAGVAKNAPNRAAAVQFIEYLLSDHAQNYLALGNNEWPVVLNQVTANPALESFGKFKRDALPISTIGSAQVGAQRLIDEVGWR
jgi:iron(III) transport system substrate-binding protein